VADDEFLGNYTCLCDDGYVRVLRSDGVFTSETVCRSCGEQMGYTNCGVFEITEVDCRDGSNGGYSCTPCPAGANRVGLITSAERCFCTPGADCPCVIACPQGTYSDVEVGLEQAGVWW